MREPIKRESGNQVMVSSMPERIQRAAELSSGRSDSDMANMSFSDSKFDKPLSNSSD